MTKENTAVAADATEVKELKFRDDLISGSKEFAPQFTGDSATGTFTLPAGVVFESSTAKQLEVTEESYMRHRNFQDLINNQLTHAGTGLSVQTMKDNPQLQNVTIKVPLAGGDYYEGIFNRNGSGRNPKTGDVSTYKGAVGVGRVVVTSTRTKAEWQNIKQNMRNLADAAGLD